jgi:hypothetical protein
MRRRNVTFLEVREGFEVAFLRMDGGRRRWPAPAWRLGRVGV